MSQMISEVQELIHYLNVTEKFEEKNDIYIYDGTGYHINCNE